MKSQTIGVLANLQNELAVYYAALALLADECYMPGSGHRMLGLSSGDTTHDAATHIDVRATRIGKLLPVWCAYAHEGVMSAGYEISDIDTADGPFERLRDMLLLLDVKDAYFQDCINVVQTFPIDVPLGGLADMVDRVESRSSLDCGASLTLGSLAVLANMNERSVRNALSVGGDGGLQVGADGRVANVDALRWLQGRRGFMPTQHRKLPTNSDELPDSLNAVEIPPFIQLRLMKVWTAVAEAEHDHQWANNVGHAGWIGAASRASGLSMERLEALVKLPLDVRPTECERLAKALQVDCIWLTHQVMIALFPEQVDMLLNPTRWRVAASEAPSAEASSSITVTLTDKMLAHGYIDIPMSAKAMFPDDCFGTRSDGDEGFTVTLKYGTHQSQSDIRIKSSKTISPRRRFNAWLNTELGARPGDRIRVEKSGDREYELTHIPS